MALSRQEAAPKKGGRANQKVRTRTALLRAAGELVREGRPPSVPEAADRALVSVATAYRYFSSAEDLWWEASNGAVQEDLSEARTRVEAAGDDPQARLEALIRTTGFRMLDDQMTYRQVARAALEQWFRQAEAPDGEPVPNRQGRRNEQIGQVVRPLRGKLSKKDLDRLSRALGLIIGTEAMIALTDAVGLDEQTAKKTLLDAGRWLLAGALAELSSDDGPRTGQLDRDVSTSILASAALPDMSRAAGGPPA